MLGIDADDGPNNLINYIIKKGLSSLPKPVILVPASISYQKIEDITSDFAPQC